MHIPTAEDSFFNTPQHNIEIKMMDTILFDRENLKKVLK